MLWCSWTHQIVLTPFQEDPLKQNLDSVFPLTGATLEPQLQVPTDLPQGVEDVLAELGKEPGVESITIGRQAEETHVVSQACRAPKMCLVQALGPLTCKTQT